MLPLVSTYGSYSTCTRLLVGSTSTSTILQTSDPQKEVNHPAASVWGVDVIITLTYVSWVDATTGTGTEDIHIVYKEQTRVSLNALRILISTDVIRRHVHNEASLELILWYLSISFLLLLKSWLLLSSLVQSSDVPAIRLFASRRCRSRFRWDLSVLPPTSHQVSYCVLAPLQTTWHPSIPVTRSPACSFFLFSVWCVFRVGHCQ